MSGPGISVLMPSFNAGEFLREAVAGALPQMNEADELVIQDGGSTDGSIDRLLAEFGSYPQLKVVSEPDGGQADALNRALARAVNPLFGWLNADDRMCPGAMDAVRGAWVANPDADFICGAWTLISPQGEVVRICQPGDDLSVRSLTRQAALFTGAMFMRTDFVREAGGFDKDLYFCMDYDLVLRLSSRNWRTVRLPDVLGEFRWHQASKTGAMDFGVVRESSAVRRRYARGAMATLEADVSSAVHFIAVLATPLRRAEWYSRLRVRRAARRVAPAPRS
ncbi:MAG TPA: glycosyltransferase [Jatrophihabitantaceae bacterium]|jgi:glycosyltransferase involved in cell wall biosynthesis|nr:glycosyltransferase [Jatrophihabitantaceae bacterium]